MNKETRESINVKLIKFDYLAKDSDFIEVTKWTNSDGYDIVINDSIYSFTTGQINAIYHLMNHLEFEL